MTSLGDRYVDWLDRRRRPPLGERYVRWSERQHERGRRRVAEWRLAPLTGRQRRLRSAGQILAALAFVSFAFPFYGRWFLAGLALVCGVGFHLDHRREVRRARERPGFEPFESSQRQAEEHVAQERADQAQVDDRARARRGPG